MGEYIMYTLLFILGITIVISILFDSEGKDNNDK